jgi:hypothetical protein
MREKVFRPNPKHHIFFVKEAPHIGGQLQKQIWRVGWIRLVNAEIAHRPAIKDSGPQQKPNNKRNYSSHIKTSLK